MKILFVTRPKAVHGARWISQLRDSGWDVHLFPATADEWPPLYRAVGKAHVSRFDAGERAVLLRVDWPDHKRGVTRAMRLLEACRPRRANRALRLARVIERIRPDIVHSLEFQHAGYLTLAARKLVRGDFPVWIAQNWGNDLYMYRHLPGHAERVREVLSAIDYHDCECVRDVAIGHELGFGGPDLPIIPNCGGFDLEGAERERSRTGTSERDVILIKGYQDDRGRMSIALRALERMDRGILDRFRVVVYSATSNAGHAAVHLFTGRTGVPVEILPRIGHDEMLRWHGRARVSVGLSLSDSISISLLEAMVMGSFPIQSDTSVADEWLKDGVGGHIVPAEDSDAIAEKLQQALTDNRLVDEAARANWRTVAERLDAAKIREQVLDMYATVYRDTRTAGTPPPSEEG